MRILELCQKLLTDIDEILCGCS